MRFVVIEQRKAVSTPRRKKPPKISLGVFHISRLCGIEQRYLVHQIEDVAVSRLCGKVLKTTSTQ